MHLPVEVIGLVAEQLAEDVAQASPFVHPTNEAEKLKGQKHCRDLLNLVVSCKDVYNITWHLLYTCLVIESPTDLITALVTLLKYPQVGPSIRHISCRTQLVLDHACDKALQYWFANHAKETALLHDTLKTKGLRPPWWDVRDIPWTCWEGFIHHNCLAVALTCVFYMATEVETLWHWQRDMGWRLLDEVRTGFDKDRDEPRPFLSNLRALHIMDEFSSGIGRWLSDGSHEKLRILILDRIGLQALSIWSDSLQFENTRIEELYLGSRTELPRRDLDLDPLFARREWVRGDWLVPGPKGLDSQAEIFQDDEEWGPLVSSVRRRMENLSAFKSLRVLDVKIIYPPERPYKALIALKNIAAASLEVFRIERYPFRVVLGEDGPCNSEYEAAFLPGTDRVLS
ncbi:hypothetical protein FSARC_9289 [Fusarium sarcochroum]|uniref:Uncharacterized protein n=1 Tax=Fusarium sarcochroum TaxID=1208366 RepID=A0A8H4TRL4_9HYPO|nr:hypothetical protein FSARC_9289 [Fusarium sarcochroum]